MKKILLILITLSTLSCITTIDSLKENPGKYADKVVKVKGKITKLIKIPFTEYSFFEITDNSNNIVVFTLNDHKKGEVIISTCKVVSFDSSKKEESTINLIDKIEEFFLDNTDFDSDKITKLSKSVGDTLSNVLNSLNSTYLLLEQSN